MREIGRSREEEVVDCRKEYIRENIMKRVKKRNRERVMIDRERDCKNYGKSYG